MDEFLISVLGIGLVAVLYISYVSIKNILNMKYDRYLVEGKYIDLLRKSQMFKKRALKKYK